jgi:hypothetical protein
MADAQAPADAPAPVVGRNPPAAEAQAAGEAVPRTFSRVLWDELNLVRKRRDLVEGRPPRDDLAVPTDRGWDEDDEDRCLTIARNQSLDDHTTGLAFSGGGIRSGTFAVGVIQGLASFGLIRRFDYLSTVSGGGYAGAWLAAWLKRQGGDPRNVEKQLNPSRVVQARADRKYLSRRENGRLVGTVVDEEPEPVRHLRAFNSYLTPNPGVLSADLWTVILIWVRNVTINLMLTLVANSIFLPALEL